MYPSEVLSRINEETRTEETSNDFISYSLEEAFLPWPLNMIHIVPDWVILTALGIIVGIDRFTLNRFLPIPILTDFENFNLTDTDTDTEN